MRISFNVSTPIRPLLNSSKLNAPLVNKRVSFSAKHPLKSDWLAGKMPSVVYGFYGDLLTKDNITLEHVLPKSKGGKSELSNFALASVSKNWSRSNRPLSEVFNEQAFERYCREMNQVHTENIDGPAYVKQLRQTVKRLLRQGL